MIFTIAARSFSSRGQTRDALAQAPKPAPQSMNRYFAGKTRSPFLRRYSLSFLMSS